MASCYEAYADACAAAEIAPLVHVLDAMANSPLGVIDARGFSGGIRLGDVDCGPLGEAVALSGCTALYASNNEIGDEGVAALVACGRVATLNTLDLSVNNIGGAGATALCNALVAEASQLFELTLDGNPLGESGGGAVAALLSTHGTIESLRLARCELNAAALVGIASALARTTTLRVLDVSETRTHSRNEETVAHFARALRANTSLERLTARKLAHLSDSGVEALCDALLDNTTLRELDLSANALGPPSGITLAKALADGAPLAVLQLSACRMGDQGAAALAATLARSSGSASASGGCSLRVLDLRYNNIGDAGIAALAAALASPECLLETLFWWGNPGLQPGSAGAAAWGAALESGGVRAVTDVRAFYVDGNVHCAREDLPLPA